MGFTSRSPPLPVLMKHLYCLWVECLSWFWTKNSGTITVFLYKGEKESETWSCRVISYAENRKGRSHLLLIFVLFPFPLTRISDGSFSVVAFFKAEIKKGKKLFRNQKQSEHLVAPPPNYAFKPHVLQRVTAKRCVTVFWAIILKCLMRNYN